MQESRDLAIKLFGQNIPLPSGEETPAAAISGYELAQRGLVDEDDDDDKDKDNVSNPTTLLISEGASQEKKKTLLRCPRCDSLDTKFCYFNNYNLKQPRHLCKSCQRYWTAGGAMRTVPVGSGRRRTKSFARSQPSNFEVEEKQQQESFYCSCCCCSSASAAAEAAKASPNLQFLPYNWWFNIPPLPPAVVGKRRQREGGGGGGVLPKTLRMDDPSQAAQSSIWTTLGIHKDGVEMMFRGFQTTKSTCDRNDGSNNESSDADYTRITSNHQLLQANPSALSRSMNFHETF